MPEPFFSIVVPAHNEERYLAETLGRLGALAYPKDRYEVIVVENGSTDGTLGIAKQHEGGNLRVIVSDEKGVSCARNRGAEAAHARGDWIMFLDADTLVGPGFLVGLAAFLERYASWRYVAGVVEVQPLPSASRIAPFYFLLGNAFRRFVRAPYTAFFIHRDLARVVRADEKAQVAEDVRFIAEARAHGRVFFFPTKEVETSVRRFEAAGWVGMAWLWVLVMASPVHHQRRMTYRVIR